MSRWKIPPLPSTWGGRDLSVSSAPTSLGCPNRWHLICLSWSSDRLSTVWLYWGRIDMADRTGRCHSYTYSTKAQHKVRGKRTQLPGFSWVGVVGTSRGPRNLWTGWFVGIFSFVRLEDWERCLLCLMRDTNTESRGKRRTQKNKINIKKDKSPEPNGMNLYDLHDKIENTLITSHLITLINKAKRTMHEKEKDRKYRKCQTEIMELKNTIIELRNSLEGFHIRVTKQKNRSANSKTGHWK